MPPTPGYFDGWPESGPEGGTRRATASRGTHVRTQVDVMLLGLELLHLRNRSVKLRS